MSTPLNGSILKAFSILRLITKERPDISAKTVASELGMTHATAHRLLLSLEEAGAVVTYRRGSFSLGPVMEELGSVAKASNRIAARISPLIEELALGLNESVMVSRLGRSGPTCIAVAASSRSISVNISVGTVLPMASSAQGKLWLAGMESAQRAQWLQDGQTSESLDLDQIETCGYACNRGENEPDIGALSVPVKSASGEIVFTLSTFGMLHRFDDPMVVRSLPVLLAMAERIKALLVRA
ncbi:IclR family transcriptional regulator [Granulosicoccus antarcticus]|uniref:Pca regulon regulatory protein n=1 Tax=Granulosicoccus antarcticus IMCC3135 TaxID=1192854 RepID=A0A2Z2NZH7_9GAMM|nr:IclR family transcriptional regulator [Granulosicoccus antarcticus]ASJ73207.1 Pca regulon regulatory protein [Granulosicoccus antarcticus IMCC3135]